MEAKTKKFVFWTTIIVTLLIFALAAVMVQLIKENSVCAKDPFTYAVMAIKEQNDLDVSCRCTFYDPNYSPFIFDKDGMRAEDIKPILSKEYQDIDSIDLNKFSELGQ